VQRSYWYFRFLAITNLLSPLPLPHLPFPATSLHTVCCVTNRTAHLDKDEVFGFGVWVDNRKIATSAEIICAGAFEGKRRVKSTQNVDISHILPLWVSAEHWAKAKLKLFEECHKMWAVNSDFRKIKPTPSDPVVALRVICRILTNMVADENTAGVLTAAKGETSDCFISGYFSVLRLLKQLAIDYQEVVAYADTTWKNFVDIKEFRLKTLCPNIGDMLPLLCITSPGIDWATVNRAYLDESSLRNVMWCVLLLQVSVLPLPAHPCCFSL
jgi:hypothetical protein